MHPHRHAHTHMLMYQIQATKMGMFSEHDVTY